MEVVSVPGSVVMEYQTVLMARMRVLMPAVYPLPVCPQVSMPCVYPLSVYSNGKLLIVNLSFLRQEF